MFQSTSNFPTHDACNLTNNNNTVIDRQTDRRQPNEANTHSGTDNFHRFSKIHNAY